MLGWHWYRLQFRLVFPFIVDILFLFSDCFVLILWKTFDLFLITKTLWVPERILILKYLFYGTFENIKQERFNYLWICFIYVGNIFKPYGATTYLWRFYYFPIFRDSYDVSIDRPRERKYEIWKEAYFSKRFCFIHLIYVVFKIPDHEIPWVFFSNNLHDKDNEID